MNDNARKGICLMLGMVAVIFALMGVGCIVGALLAGAGMGSPAGQVGAVFVVLGAVFGTGSITAAPKGATNGS